MGKDPIASTLGPWGQHLFQQVQKRLRRFSWRVDSNLDIKAMNQVCEALIGRHDFASFVASEETARQKRTVRDVYKAEIKRDGDTVTFDMVANSFLPHQVRNTIGTLVKVGQGKMTESEFRNIVEVGKPGMAGPTAPPDGLFLMQVNYPGPFCGDK